MMSIAEVAKRHKLSPIQADAAEWVRARTLGFTRRDYRDARITTGTMASLERCGLVVIFSNHGREFPHSGTTYVAGPDLDSQAPQSAGDAA
jgi:hypothetical protein